MLCKRAHCWNLLEKCNSLLACIDCPILRRIYFLGIQCGRARDYVGSANGGTLRGICWSHGAGAGAGADRTDPDHCVKLGTSFRTPDFMRPVIQWVLQTTKQSPLILSFRTKNVLQAPFPHPIISTPFNSHQDHIFSKYQTRQMALDYKPSGSLCFCCNCPIIWLILDSSSIHRSL